ncbi:TPA: type V toxin-antitoxin system endoribonuclease antitoxin GhoS [Salmonella enterica subsp. enterica serovar Concord]|nr:type V toxin-antitoxin system endoribonuclease antitoxin GhoS [Salmonella enterica subsp. enterica serovar Concord]
MGQSSITTYIVTLDCTPSSSVIQDAIDMILFKEGFSTVITDSHGIPRSLKRGTYAITSTRSQSDIEIMAKTLYQSITGAESRLKIEFRDDYFS